MPSGVMPVAVGIAFWPQVLPPCAHAFRQYINTLRTTTQDPSLEIGTTIAHVIFCAASAHGVGTLPDHRHVGKAHGLRSIQAERLPNSVGVESSSNCSNSRDNIYIPRRAGPLCEQPVCFKWRYDLLCGQVFAALCFFGVIVGTVIVLTT